MCFFGVLDIRKEPSYRTKGFSKMEITHGLLKADNWLSHPHNWLSSPKMEGFQKSRY